MVAAAVFTRWRTRGCLGSGTVAVAEPLGAGVRRGTGGAAWWLVAEGASGPFMLWSFDVDHEAFAEAVEPVGAVVRVGV